MGDELNGAGGGDPGNVGAPPQPVVAPAGGGGQMPPPAAGPGAPNTPPLTDEEFARRVREGGWLPRHVGQRLSQRGQALERQLQESQRRIQALAGVEPPPDPQEQQIREALQRMYPVLGRLTPDHVDRLVEALDSGQLEIGAQVRDFVFGRTAAEVSRNAATKWAEATGRDPKSLTRDQTARIGRELMGFIEADQTGERNRRYDMGDGTLIDEFIDDLTSFYGRQTPAGDGSPVTPPQGAGPGSGVPPVGAGAPAVRQARQLPRTGPNGGPGTGPGGPQRLDRKLVGEAARRRALEGS